MSRAKEFDVDHALDSAIELFREKGYEGTSLRELEARTGVGRQSLYDTFGDKRQLFLRAMDRYTGDNQSRVRERLHCSEAGIAELRQYFDDVVVALTPRGGERLGCLVTGAILEIGDADTDVAHRCHGNEKSLKRVFRGVLDRARRRGELRADVNVDQTATFLMGQIYGLTVLARNGSSRPSLQRVVDLVFDAL